jgi:hypothetical protein
MMVLPTCERKSITTACHSPKWRHESIIAASYIQRMRMENACSFPPKDIIMRAIYKLRRAIYGKEDIYKSKRDLLSQAERTNASYFDIIASLQ